MNSNKYHISNHNRYKAHNTAYAFKYKSWGEYFTRQFQPGKRPVGGPNPIWLDSDRVVLSACESAPLAVDTNASLDDTFLLKGQPYSLENILDFDGRAK